MAFYLESEFLDKKNIYQNFSYESLIDKTIISAESIKDHQNSGETQIHEEISQNTYLYVQEKDILLTDIKNICIYFHNKIVAKDENINEE